MWIPKSIECSIRDLDATTRSGSSRKDFYRVFLYNSFTIRSWLRIQIEILLVKRYAAFKVPPGTPWKPDAVIRTALRPGADRRARGFYGTRVSLERR